MASSYETMADATKRFYSYKLLPSTLKNFIFINLPIKKKFILSEWEYHFNMWKGGHMDDDHHGSG